MGLSGFLSLPLAACGLALAGAAQAGETITYDYDELGRLAKVSHAGSVNGGIEAGYNYDATDNRTNVTVSASAVSQPIVAGGGFEAPDKGSGYQYNPGGDFTGQSGVAGNGSAWGFAAAPEGDQVAFLQNGATKAKIRLQVTGLVPGLSYKASFRIAGRPGYLGMPVTVTFAGSPIGTFTPTTFTFTAATSAAFTAAATTGTLEFEGIATPDNMVTGIDLVTVAVAN
jgi:hypothetical protein